VLGTAKIGIITKFITDSKSRPKHRIIEKTKNMQLEIPPQNPSIQA
jgi:hypothetical protein